MERGETITIPRGGTPIARLSGIGATGERELGFLGLEIPDEFFAPLPDEELSLWAQ